MKQITSNFIIQIAGKPKKAVEEALAKVSNDIKSNKNYEILEEEIYEPEKDEKEILYSGLINLRAKFNNFIDLFNFIHDYLPISVEIEDPNKLELSLFELNEILNAFSKKSLESMHQINNLKIYIHQLKKKYNINNKDNKEDNN